MSADYKADLNNDGIIGVDEVELLKRRMSTQRKIALFAVVALIVSGIWIIGFMPTEKVEALGGALDLYWISLAGIIAAYMGAEAWAIKK